MAGLLILIILVLLVVVIVLVVLLSTAKRNDAAQMNFTEEATRRHSEFVRNLQNGHSREKAQMQESFNQEVRRLQGQMNNLAGERFQEWRRSECEIIRKTERETALQEASLHLEHWKFQSETSIRNDAIQRSQSVIIGKVSEHLLPYMPEFPYNPKDVKFLGSPVDLNVFDGMSDGDVKQIVLIEIKTGQSAALTTRERQIRNIVQDKNIIWQEMRITRND